MIVHTSSYPRHTPSPFLQNPEWKGATANLLFDHRCAKFKVNVMDKDDFGSDLIGVFKVEIPKFYGHPLHTPVAMEGWFPLRKSLRAQIHLRITVTWRVPAAVPGLPIQLPTAIRDAAGVTPSMGIGLGWSFAKGAKEIDLDASVVVLDANYKACSRRLIRNLHSVPGPTRYWCVLFEYLTP